MIYYDKRLFHQISYDEYATMRSCLSAREMSFRAGETICSFETSKQYVGILASGSASTVRYEPNGSRTILEQLEPQDIFGAVLSFHNILLESIYVICSTDCQVLFFNYDHILSPCSKVCSCHQQLIQNMLQIISDKAIMLGVRVSILSKRTTREKLLYYFFYLSEIHNSNCFQLPFTMVDLADYLSVDRSAMSRELKKLKNENLVSVNKGHVCILSKDAIIDSFA